MLYPVAVPNLALVRPRLGYLLLPFVTTYIPLRRTSATPHELLGPLLLLRRHNEQLLR